MTMDTARRAFIAGIGATAALGATGSLAHPVTLPERFLPQLVNTYRTDWLAGDIHVTPDDFFLYFMLDRGLAIRYGVGVGRANLYEAGTFTVQHKAEWPRWRPTDAMIRREPGRYARFADGVPGGPENPLGARALYIFQNGQDTLYRLHGSPEYWTIGRAVSSGCVRLINQDIIDLYDRVATPSPIFVRGSASARAV